MSTNQWCHARGFILVDDTAASLILDESFSTAPSGKLGIVRRALFSLFGAAGARLVLWLQLLLAAVLPLPAATFGRRPRRDTPPTDMCADLQLPTAMAHRGGAHAG